MTREETLRYFNQKKQLVTPVAAAEDGVRKAKKNLEKAEGFLSKTIIAFAIFAVLYFMGGSHYDPENNPNYHFLFYFRNGGFQLGQWGGVLVFGGIALALYNYKKKSRVNPAKAKLVNAQSVLSEEKNYPEYVKGKQGFPIKFYNYNSLYRLYNLVAEGRADHVKEAFNLLEQQQFQETQISIQKEMQALQVDIAKSARATAVSTAITAGASVVTASNTSKIANNTSKSAGILEGWDKDFRR